MPGPKSIFDTFSDIELQKMLDTSGSYREVVIKAGLSDRSGNFQTLKRNIRTRGLSTKKLDSNRKESLSRNAKRTNKMQRKYSLEDILVENSQYTNNYALRNKLIKAGLLKYECYECGVAEWNGKPISLQLDHKNGIHHDCRIENLRLLCPNCHSQTATFGAKNKKIRRTSH